MQIYKNNMIFYAIHTSNNHFFKAFYIFSIEKVIAIRLKVLILHDF